MTSNLSVLTTVFVYNHLQCPAQLSRSASFGSSGASLASVCVRSTILPNPAASVSGGKDTVVEGKTPEITIDQARKLIASVKLTYMVKAKGQKPQEVVRVVGLRDRAILATLACTACRAGAIAELRLQDFQHDGE